MPEARSSHAREETHLGRGGEEDSSQEIDLPTQMAAIENSVALCRECLAAAGSDASKDEVLNDLVRHLGESAPRLTAAIGTRGRQSMRTGTWHAACALQRMCAVLLTIRASTLALTEGESVRDEALLGRLLLLHESVAAVLLAHQRVLDGNVLPDPFPSSTRAPPPAPPPVPPSAPAPPAAPVAPSSLPSLRTPPTNLLD